MSFRIGNGFDVHRFSDDPSRPLVLGGVHIAGEVGLEGHSDADVVAHAVAEALLGATGLGDIGRLFPDTEARWKDANSLDLLSEVGLRVHEAGFAVANIDVVVIAERPKLASHAGEMRANLAEALGIPAECVSVKGKTNEAVDATGRGEAIAVHAVALVARRR